MQQCDATVSTSRDMFFWRRIGFFFAQCFSYLSQGQKSKVSTLIAFGLFLIVACVPSAKAEAAIQFVGSTTASGVNTAYNMSLSSLTGGIGSAPAQNDIIIVTNTFNDIADGNPGVASVGYTEVADLYVNDTRDVNTSVSYIFATSTPVTSVTCNGSANTASSSVCTAMVFRGVNTSNPMDVTATTTAAVMNTEDIDCPVITPVTTGAYVVCAGGAVGASVSAAFATISGYTHQYKQADAGGAAASVMAYKAWTSGAENPAAFVLNMGTAAQNSWAAVTMALRPAPLAISGTLFSDEGITAITSSKTIKLAVGTSSTPTVYSTTSNASGVWSFGINGALIPSAPLLVWVDGDATTRASLFTKASTTGGDMTGLSLYQNRVIVSHEATTSTSTTVANLSFYDNSNDTDIQYSATSSTGEFTIFGGQELHVWTGKVMELSGSSTLIGDVHIATSSRLLGGATTTIQGHFTNQGLYNPNSGHLWSSTLSQTVNLVDVAYGGGMFVGVSDGGSVVYSYDGVEWAWGTAELLGWEAVAYGNGVFVAVGDFGALATSVNGIVWTSGTAVEGNTWRAITYGGGQFVALAKDGTTRVMTSPDGIAWTGRTAAEANTWISITYGLGSGTTTPLYVAVSYDGTNRVMTSPNGINWTVRSASEANGWRGITYGNGLFVAVADSGTNRVMTSTNGVTWTARPAAAANVWYDVVYGNGVFVAVADGTQQAMTSVDGIKWNAMNGSVSARWFGITYGEGVFVAAGYDNIMSSRSSLFFSSSSAQTLFGTTTGTSTFGSVTFSGSGTKTFIHNASTTNLTINTGATVVAPPQLTISNTYQNTGTFTAGSGTTTFSDYATASGTLTGTSAFNTVVISGTSSSTVRFTSNASTTNLFVQQYAKFTPPPRLTASGTVGVNGTYDSFLGQNWSANSTGLADAKWYDIAYGNGTFVAVGYEGAGTTGRVMTSPDGITWTSRTPAFNGYLEDIAFGNGVFVIISSDNGIMTSHNNGVTWAAQSSAFSSGNINDVAYGNGRFVAVGWQNSTGGVMSSPDGVSWTLHTSPDVISWRTVAYGGDKFVVLGDEKYVMTSTNGTAWSSGSMASISCGYTCSGYSITYGNGLFVAIMGVQDIGYDFPIVTSPDGITWTSQHSVDDWTYWVDIIYTNNMFVVVGVPTYATAPVVMTSFNGVDWTPQLYNNGTDWVGVAYGNGKVVAIGETTTNGKLTMLSDSLLHMNGASAQNISGMLTGTSSLGDVAFTGASTKTFSNNASTSNFTVNSGATVVAPALLSVSGNYTNSGTFTAGSNTVVLNGDSAQTASGTMTGTSAFNNLTITNTSGIGSSTLQSVRFGASASTTGTLTMLASTSANFKASATSTFQNISLQGSAGSPVYIRSSIPGTRAAFYVPGTQSQVTYVDVKDSSACPTTISVTSGTDSGNNLCWSFGASAGTSIISGTLYTNEGTTPYTASTTINIAVSTSTTPVVYATSTNTSGAFSFTIPELTTTARITAWVNASTSVRAAFFTKTTAATSTMTSVPLYKDRVIISHEGATTSTSTSVTDLAFYDNSDDTDIQYSATSSTGEFVVFNGQELYVYGGKQFSLIGSSTLIGNVHIATSSTLVGGSTTTIQGHFDNNAGVYIPAWAVTTFSSSTAQTISGNLSGASSLGSVAFTGAGTKTLANNASTSDMTINAGATVVAPAQLTIGGNYSNSGTFTAGSGTTTFSGSSWDVSQAAYSGLLKDVSAQDVLPQDVTFSPDGTKMYVVGNDGDMVYQYTLSTAWDVSTASYASLSVSTAGQDVTPVGIIFSPDGAKMYVTGWANSSIYQYTLSTPWNISTASYASLSKDVSAQANPHSAFFSPDGTKMYVAGYNTNTIYQYTLSTPWNISTASYASLSKDVSAQESQVSAAVFSPDGAKMYMMGYNNTSTIYQYTLSTPWNISTASYTSLSKNISSQDASYALAVAFSTDGAKMYMVGMSNNGAVYQYNFPQTATGTMTGTSAFNNVVVVGSSTATFNSNASTTHLTINQGSTVVAAPSLTIGGNLTNNGTYDTGVGKRWILSSAAEVNTWRAVTYGNGLFVAVPDTGSDNRPMTSPDGITWTPRGTTNNSDWQSITYGNGMFVAVESYSTGRTYYSYDGITWNLGTAAQANFWNSVTYGNGKFVAVGESGTNHIMTSTDGVSWTAQTGGGTKTWTSVTYGLASGTTTPLYVAVACGSAPSTCDTTVDNRVMTSPDGVNWTERSAAGNDDEWLAVTYGNGLFVAVGRGDFNFGGDRIMTSSDGVTWTVQQYPVANGWSGITYGDGLFVAVAVDGGIGDNIMTSSNGAFWTTRPVPEVTTLQSVAYGNGTFVAVSSDGTNQVMTSDSLLTMSSTSAQTLSGTLTATSSLGNVAFTGAGTKTFSNNASTTNFTINSGATVVAPAQLSIAGNYTNSGTFTAGTGTTTFNGTGMQTATGTMVGTSAFRNIVITNTSGFGSSTLQSVRFGAVASTTDTLTMLASTSANFKASATSTFQNISLQGSAGQYVMLRSSIPGTRTSFYVPGTVKTATYVDVKDNSACPTTITVTNGADSGNNLCWTFSAGAGTSIISGTLYTNEGATPYTASTTINIAVSTSTTPVVYATSTNTSGVFSFTIPQLTTTARITAWVNASTSVRAAFFTKTTAATSTMTSVPLYKDRVLISHEGATTSTSTSVADMAFYDNSDDTDIQYSATSTTGEFSVFNGQELYVYGAKKFITTGSSTLTGNVHIATSSQLATGGTTTIMGHFDNNAGVYVAGGGTTIFSSTTAQSIRDAANGASALGNVAFTGAGTKTFSGNASTSNFTINVGATVVAPTLLAINGNYSNSGTFTAGSGTTTFGGSSWNISSAIYTGKSKNASAQGTYLGGVSFSVDGTKMYVVDYSASTIYQYTLAVAWDVSTASYASLSKDVGAADGLYAPAAAVFSPDGTKMYVVGYNAAVVYQYTLSTPWNVSTASYASLSKNVGAQEATPESVSLSPDGTKMYVVGASNDTVYQYTLSTPWNVSTASYASLSKNVGVEENVPSGVTFSPDGTKMYVVGTTNDSVYQYTLPTAWDVSTALYASLSKSVGTEEVNTNEVVFSPDGTKMYIVGPNSSTVYQYSIAQTVSGTMTGTSAFNNVVVNSASEFQSNASTTNFTINTDATVVAPTLLGINGNYTNNGTFTAGSGTTTFNGTTAQTIYGNLTGTSTLRNVAFTGAGTKTFSSNASTTNFTVNSGATVVAPAYLTITGHYNNAGTFTAGSGTTTFSSTTAQTIAGTMTGTSAFKHVGLNGASTKTFSSNASTSNLSIGAGTTMVAPTLLSIAGDYNNAGTFTAGSGTTTFNGTGLQSATGTMTGTSAFKHVEVTNNSATTTFNAPFTATGHFKATAANTYLAFPKNATTTLTTATIGGTSGNEVHMRSTTSGTRWGLAISGAYNISYADVKDGNGSSTAGNITATSSVDSGNNNRWTFASGAAGSTTKPSVISAVVVDATTTSASKAVTVPVGTTYVVAFWSAYDASYVTLSSITLDGDAFTLHENYTHTGLDSSYAVGSRVWTKGSGSFNLGWTMDVAPAEGAPIVVAFIKDVSATTPYTDSAGDSWDINYTTQSVQVSSPTSNHLVLGVIQSFKNPGDAPDGAQDDQSILFGIDDYYVKQEAVDLVQENTTDTPTTTITAYGDYPSLVAISIAPMDVVEASASLSSASNQGFYYTQATTTASTMTVTNIGGAPVTAANDIRIRIASTTVNMKWDTTDTTATFGGTASGKVANPVSYENNGTTLVIPVSNDFAAGETLTIDGVSFSQFLGVNAATVGLNMYLGGASDAVSDDADDKTISISGLTTLIDHTAGQVSDNITSTTEVGIPLYAFNMGTVGENGTISSLTLRFTGANGVTDSDLSGFALYRDNNSNGTYEAGDTAVGGTPVLSLTGETGTVTFSTSFTSTSTAKNYVLVGSVDNVRVTEGFTLSLSAADITMSGATSGLMTQTSSLTRVQHMKGGGGGSAGGSHAAIGDAPPSGDGVRGGGGSGGGGGIDPDSGTPIGSEPGFNAPAGQGSPQGAWTSGTNAYTSNGAYTTTSGNGARHTYNTFGFDVPVGNTIVGVEVKVEASGSTAAGTISVGLSWNNGASLTSLKTTSTLGLTDAVFLLGGPADTWGRSWTASEFGNGSFAIEIVGNTSSNTLSVDAIQTKVYHQSSGGGGGGGGGAL